MQNPTMSELAQEFVGRRARGVPCLQSYSVLESELTYCVRWVPPSDHERWLVLRGPYWADLIKAMRIVPCIPSGVMSGFAITAAYPMLAPGTHVGGITYSLPTPCCAHEWVQTGFIKTWCKTCNADGAFTAGVGHET